MCFLTDCLSVFTGENNEKVQRFKRWFWSVVEKMNNHERQDLVCTYTSLHGTEIERTLIAIHLRSR